MTDVGKLHNHLFATPALGWKSLYTLLAFTRIIYIVIKFMTVGHVALRSATNIYLTIDRSKYEFPPPL